MAKCTEWIQDNDSHLVPIYASYDMEQGDPTLPSLAYLLDAKTDDLPHIYFFNSYTGLVMAFPEKLDDVKKFSPELVIEWTSIADIEINLQVFESQLAMLDETPELEEGEEPMPEEEKELIRAELKDSIELYTKELEDAKAAYEATRKALEAKNDFADNLDEHLEVSALHLARIEQSIYEELLLDEL